MAGPPVGKWPQILSGGECTFELDEVEYVVPPRKARRWMDALSTGDPFDIVPGLCRRRDREALAARAFDYDDPFDVQMAQQVADHVLFEVTGLHAFTVSRLVHDVIRAHWMEFDGWCASQHIEPLELPFPRALRLAYSWLTKDIQSTEDWEKVNAELFEPSMDMLAEYDPDDEENLPPGWDAESAGESWAAAASGFTRG